MEISTRRALETLLLPVSQCRRSPERLCRQVPARLMGKAGGARRRALTDAAKKRGHGEYELAENWTIPLETTIDYTKKLPYQRHTVFPKGQVC
jgi:hypothetical protein